MAPSDPAAPTWRKAWPREYFESICIAVIFALFIRTFVVQAFKIPSKSMEDNLLVGDHILVNKFAHAARPAWLEGWLPYRPLARGDVVVFKYPVEPQRDFIKRVVGVGGDRVEVRRGVVLRGGRPLDEPCTVIKLPEEYRGPRPAADDLRLLHNMSMSPLTVPPGHYFVMGDNRVNSEDSRVWGTVPPTHIKGRALAIYWSFDVPPELQPIEVDPAPSAGERSRVLRYTFLNFFNRTRWGRTFNRVAHGCGDDAGAEVEAAADAR